MTQPVNLPKASICDLNCFLEPNHLGPHQFDPTRSWWVQRVKEGKVCACGEWPEYCCCVWLVREDEMKNGTIEDVEDGIGVTIYLCGPMASCTDEEMHGWREQLKKDYPNITWLDPCDRSYKSQQWRRLVDDDIADIDNADYVLSHYWKSGTGSAMELSYNYYVAKKPSIVVVPGFKTVSPWLRYHADYLVDSFEHAMKIILNKDTSKF